MIQKTQILSAELLFIANTSATQRLQGRAIISLILIEGCQNNIDWIYNRLRLHS